MKVAIFGGSGKTGRYLIQQSLHAGHQVVALVRTPAKLNLQHPNLRVIQGSILEAESVSSTVQGADAVISVLGPSSNKPEFAISRGMDNILAAMQTHSVRRIIISAGAGVREADDRPKSVDRFFGLLLGIVSKNVVADMQQVVQKVKSSDRDWTVVRVPMLTDAPAQGSLKVGVVGDISPRIARADMAAFMLEQVSDSRFIRKAPAISN